MILRVTVICINKQYFSEIKLLNVVITLLEYTLIPKVDFYYQLLLLLPVFCTKLRIVITY